MWQFPRMMPSKLRAICTQFSDRGSSREEVVANEVRLEGTGDAVAGPIADIAVKNDCPQHGRSVEVDVKLKSWLHD
ncbi:hypothetical protein CH291_05580 [Rhodococcus sp. 14-1411-2a]|nr:hypothetical protein CH291_05580 [Rhodococcus sp. 14-1411-2a]